MADVDQRLNSAKVAVGVAFAMNGFAYAGWLSRAPAAQDALDIVGMRQALLVVLGALAVGLAASGAARPLKPAAGDIPAAGTPAAGDRNRSAVLGQEVADD
ncbi:hypothetical protein AMIS_68890 [Actinoplanes missouriensis 431]|uniref:Uncharacterized protein n=1 Tax=Actinoplanes missouriensis (strain ATCC 14538 / DSM 43046 / CBS 188.64 / JCM 3121 / NBRC 102363 / NCIMB 12654 / NRRL B-3342 / UNCC 431) TaxID=512565 RepID=I0HGH2_ACTM4|nr:hypothetical protein [Actinoplanes missouriensis]BAL92109.1 hypothetical protein AMIS_68890 [Actinoplanes missouriensis 431]